MSGVEVVLRDDLGHVKSTKSPASHPYLDVEAVLRDDLGHVRQDALPVVAVDD